MKLASTAHILVENLPLGRMEEMGLSYSALREVNRELVVTSITPFGNGGPYSDFKASDLVIYHMSSLAPSLVGPVEQPDRQPAVRAGGHQAEFVAGMAAATATLMALYRVRMTGEGCRVEVSSFEAMVNQNIAGLASCAYGEPAPFRDLGKQREAESAGGVSKTIGGVLPCSDGYVAISPREDAQWQRWLELMGNPEWSDDERFATRENRERNAGALWDLLSQWTRGQSKYDIARRGQERRIACFPVNTVADLFDNEHLADRSFFQNMDHPRGREAKIPRRRLPSGEHVAGAGPTARPSARRAQRSDPRRSGV